MFEFIHGKEDIVLGMQMPAQNQYIIYHRGCVAQESKLFVLAANVASNNIF